MIVRVRPNQVTLAPDVFSFVMATGILSIAARNHHYWRIGDTLGGVASIGLASLLAVAVGTVAVKHSTAGWNLKNPDVTLRLFTFVAACAVLDTRLSSHPMVLWPLGAVAFSSWLLLMLLAARIMSQYRWAALRDQAHGAWELASVGSSGLAIVITQVAYYTDRHSWAMIAVPIWLSAIAIYGLMTWLILWRAVAERQDRNGFAPDTWILMGALAIATLAGHSIYQLAPDWLTGSVRAVTVMTWIAATLWIAPLTYFGLYRISRRPERLRFSGAWWALVFPLGMYSAATDAMAAELHLRSLQTVSLVFFWNALAAWVIVVVAGLLGLRRAFLART